MHRIRFPIPARVSERAQRRIVCDVATRCWLWTGSVNTSGYGIITFPYEGRVHGGLVHRVMWEARYGSVPDELDHICRVRLCCNPAHLQETTRRSNNLGSNSISSRNARKTVCVNGHPFTPDNTYRVPTGGRGCRACGAARARSYYWRKKKSA